MRKKHQGFSLGHDKLIRRSNTFLQLYSIYVCCFKVSHFTPSKSPKLQTTTYTYLTLLLCCTSTFFLPGPEVIKFDRCYEQMLKREGAYVYTKEGTRVPSLNTGPVVTKKTMSPCSIWQGLWAAAQERRCLCAHKRGTLSLLSICTWWTKPGVSQIWQDDWAAAEHLLSPFSSPFFRVKWLYDYGFWPIWPAMIMKMGVLR